MPLLAVAAADDVALAQALPDPLERALDEALVVAAALGLALRRGVGVGVVAPLRVGGALTLRGTDAVRAAVAEPHALAETEKSADSEPSPVALGEADADGECEAESDAPPDAVALPDADAEALKGPLPLPLALCGAVEVEVWLGRVVPLARLDEECEGAGERDGSGLTLAVPEGVAYAVAVAAELGVTTLLALRAPEADADGLAAADGVAAPPLADGHRVAVAVMLTLADGDALLAGEADAAPVGETVVLATPALALGPADSEAPGLEDVTTLGDSRAEAVWVTLAVPEPALAELLGSSVGVVTDEEDGTELGDAANDADAAALFEEAALADASQLPVALADVDAVTLPAADKVAAPLSVRDKETLAQGLLEDVAAALAEDVAVPSPPESLARGDALGTPENEPEALGDDEAVGDKRALRLAAALDVAASEAEPCAVIVADTEGVDSDEPLTLARALKREDADAPPLELARAVTEPLRVARVLRDAVGVVDAEPLALAAFEGDAAAEADTVLHGVGVADVHSRGEADADSELLALALAVAAPVGDALAQALAEGLIAAVVEGDVEDVAVAAALALLAGVTVQPPVTVASVDCE